MKFNKKSALKFVGLQVALIIAIFATQAVMIFFSQNRILVIESKDNSWVGIAETAQADNQSCLQQLDQVKKEKQQAIESNNQDIMK